MGSINNSLALFLPGVKERAIQETDWINYRSIGQISKNGTLDFVINGTSGDLVLLSKTRLNVKLRVLKADGTPITKDDPVTLANLSLHSMFRQVDVSLGQQVITPSVGVNYPYKAMADVLLNLNYDATDSFLEAVGFYKEQGPMDNVLSNIGHIQRNELIKNGSVEFEGVLQMDVAQQPRAILNGVQISVKLYQNDDSFRLISNGATDYQVEIEDAVLKVCHLKLNPSVVLATNERLKRSPALYPYWRSDIKTFSISQGAHTFTTDDMFHGLVPNRLVVSLVRSSSYSGNMLENPFRFQHFDLNYLELAVNGRSVPTVPFQPKFTVDPEDSANYLPTGFVHEYLSLFKNENPQQETSNFIKRDEYPNGYSFFVFSVRDSTGEDVFSRVSKGHTRLSARFAAGVPEPVTVIVYGIFPDEFKIDHARNVTI